MVTPIIKKIFLLGFIVLNIQKIQPFCCCKNDTTINTKFNAQQDSTFLQNKTDLKESTIQTVQNQTLSSVKPTDNNDQIQVQEETQKQDYHNPITQAQIENNNEIKYSPRNTPKEIVLSSLAKIAAENNDSNNLVVENNKEFVTSTNPVFKTESNPIGYSPVNENIQPDVNCSLCNIATSFNNQSNSQRKVVMYEIETGQVAIPLRVGQSSESKSIENSNKTFDVTELNRCIDENKKSKNKKIFNSSDSSKKYFNDQEDNPMPHQVQSKDIQSSNKNKLL